MRLSFIKLLKKDTKKLKSCKTLWNFFLRKTLKKGNEKTITDFESEFQILCYSITSFSVTLTTPLVICTTYKP